MKPNQMSLFLRLGVVAAMAALTLLWPTGWPTPTAQAAITERPTIHVPNRAVVAREGKGFVQLIDGQFVIHLEGTPYEMGYQMGKMVPERTRQNLDAYANIFGRERRQNTIDSLKEIWNQAEPFIPQSIKDELRGLAEGSGCDLELIQIAHILPEKYHCSGAAAWGQQTVDGKLYHFRSLDYSLHIGAEVKVQENAALIVRKPTGKVPSLVVGWAGTIGCVTGMNAKGISIGEMGCTSNQETYEGFPMFFLLRYILEEAETLDQALEIMRRGPRTCGYNFIFGDGKAPHPRAVALEVDRTRMMVFEGGDEAEDVAPHFSIPQCVRRVNHFVDPELASRQRRIYDPSISSQSSWLGYKLISDYLRENAGRIDAQKMIQICRSYPPTHPCLHQAVMCPSDGRIWVANAVNPDETVFAGAQNQPFYEYNLHDLLATDPATLPQQPMPPPIDPKVRAQRPAARTMTGTVRGTPLAGAVPEDAELGRMWKRYRDAAIHPEGGSFTWKLTDSGVGSQAVAVAELSFPSNVANGAEANHTVVARCYAKRGNVPTQGAASAMNKMPALVMLHHLADDQTLENMLANFFAADGRFVMLLYLPNYGPRRGVGPSVHQLMMQAELESSFTNFAQAIWDIHRCRDWLRAQPFIDQENISLLGISLGGLVSSISAGVDPGFSRYVIALAGGNFSEIIAQNSREVRGLRQVLNERGITDEQVRAQTRAFDPLTFADRADTERIFMLNAARDEVIPKSSSEQLWNAFGQPPIQWYDVNHGGMAMYLFDAMQRIRRFLDGSDPLDGNR